MQVLLPKDATPGHESTKTALYQQVWVLVETGSADDIRKGEAYAQAFHEELRDWEHNPSIRLDEEDSVPEGGDHRILLTRIARVEERLGGNASLEELRIEGRIDSMRFRETVEQRMQAQAQTQTRIQDPAWSPAMA